MVEHSPQTLSSGEKVTTNNSELASFPEIFHSRFAVHGGGIFVFAIQRLALEPRLPSPLPRPFHPPTRFLK